MNDFIEIARNAILLGPTEAGKTELLWAAHHAAQMSGRNQRFSLPSDCAGITLDDGVQGNVGSLFDALFGSKGVVTTRQDGGRPSGTDIVYQTAFEIRIHHDPPRAQERALFQMTDLAGRFSARSANEQSRMYNFEDVKSVLDMDTATTLSITNGVDSVIQCIPLHDLPADLELDTLLQNMNHEKLRSITICITKFDAVFLEKSVLFPDALGHPRTHYAAANDPEFVRPILKERLSRPDVIPLMDAIRDRDHAEIKVMPVSGFGFLAETGQANVRPLNGAKHQMLTAVKEEGEAPETDYPYTFKDVYAAERYALWRPFQAFEALFSVLFSTQEMREAELCVFDLHEVLTEME